MPAQLSQTRSISITPMSVQVPQFPQLELKAVLLPETKKNIAEIFDIKDPSFFDKVSMLMEDYVKYSRILDLLAAAQACNYKKLKELLQQDSRYGYVPLPLLYKARNLAEGKEHIFQGVSRIFYADPDECVKLIDNKIKETLEFQYLLQAQQDEENEEEEEEEYSDSLEMSEEF
jgi:hypothetical protein